MLRAFDLTSSFGPCTGMSRLERLAELPCAGCCMSMHQAESHAMLAGGNELTSLACSHPRRCCTSWMHFWMVMHSCSAFGMVASSSEPPRDPFHHCLFSLCNACL